MASWYANVFDAFAVLLLALGLWLMTRGRFVAAGLVFGAGFFCKETVVLALPLLLWLLALGRISPRDAARTAIPTVSWCFLLRVARVRVAFRLGHGYAYVRPTTSIFVSTFWLQTTWAGHLRLLGLAAFAFSFAALGGWRVRGAFLLLVATCVLIYLEMFAWQQDLI